MKRKALILDDYKTDRMLFERVLKHANFEVLEAGTAGEAQRILGDNKNISLIISDLKLPCMPGIDFLMWAKEHYPDAVLAAISGRSDLREKARLRDIGVLFVLEKPFTSIDMPPIMAAIDLREAAFEKGRKMKPSWVHRILGGLVLMFGAAALSGWFDPIVTKMFYVVSLAAGGTAIMLGVDQKVIADILLRRKNGS